MATTGDPIINSGNNHYIVSSNTGSITLGATSGNYITTGTNNIAIGGSSWGTTSISYIDDTDQRIINLESRLKILEDEKVLRDRYDVVREAYENYQLLLKLHEDAKCDETFKQRYGIDDKTE